MDAITFVVSMLVGTLMILIPSWLFYKYRKFSAGSLVFAVLGGVFVAMPLWSLDPSSMPDGAVAARVEKLEARLRRLDDLVQEKSAWTDEAMASLHEKTRAADLSMASLNEKAQFLAVRILAAYPQLVRQLQGRLRREGVYTGAIDGFLGQMTRQALANYQQQHGLEATGEIDEATIKLLDLRF